MSWDDILYISLLLIAIPYGHLVKLSKSRANKQLMCLVGGLIVAMSVVGLKGIWHSFLTICGNIIILNVFGPRHCRLPSFLFVFGYLFFFRTCSWYGFQKPPAQCNAIQLLITLKMVGLAFEIHQSSKEAAESSKVLQPSIYDIFSYGYCYCGQLTGPHFTYKTFSDMLNQDGSKIATILPAIEKFKPFLIIALPYLFLNIYFPISHMESKEFLDHPLGIIYQLAYLVPTFTWFRWRFHIGWSLAETICTTLSLGAYPFDSLPRPGHGPTKPIEDNYDPEEAAKTHNGHTHSFETIDNIDILKVELAPTMKMCMRSWNKTVQWWMAVCVHKQLPFKSWLRMIVVLFVSAFWHGVHPGYYLTFMSVPMVVLAEDRMIPVIKSYLTLPWQFKALDWVTWFCLYRSFEYLGVGFMMLHLSSVWTVWKRMYFIGHIFIVLFIILPFFIPKRRQGDVNVNDKSKDAKSR